jgi:hypothetical protein
MMTLTGSGDLPDQMIANGIRDLNWVFGQTHSESGQAARQLCEESETLSGVTLKLKHTGRGKRQGSLGG